MKHQVPTIRDVAKRAGVSPITVSRVINNSGYISEPTRQRVEEAIAALDYVPNSLSQSLRFKKTNTVALVISDITNQFWTTITRGVEDACSEQGLNVIICNTDEQHGKLTNYINVLLQRQIDGFILAPTEENATDMIWKIQKQQVPLVVLDRLVRGVEVDVVRGDSEGGAYALVNYLIGLGHRRIAILTGPKHISTSWQRVDGYRQALEDNGLRVDENLILWGEFRPETGYHHTLNVLQEFNPRPTAFFGANNFIAMGILKAVYEQGLRVPEDVSVVSFDEIPRLDYLKPFVTVAAQNPYDMGFQAAQLLIDLISGAEKAANRDIVLSVVLNIRASCRPLLAEEMI